MKTRRSIASQVKGKEEGEECSDGKEENNSDKSLLTKVIENLDEQEVKKPKLLRRSNVSFFDEKKDNLKSSPVKFVGKSDNSELIQAKISDNNESLDVSSLKLMEKNDKSKIAKIISPKKITTISILDETKESDNFTCLDDLCLIDDDYDAFYEEVCSVVTTHHNVDKSKGGTEAMSATEKVSNATLTLKPVGHSSIQIVPEKISITEKVAINHLEQLELLYHDELQNIMNSQKDCVQCNIVIVTDDRDIFDVSLVGFDSRVEVLKIPGLSFANAFGSIKNHKNFGKGTIFVFICGIYDLLQTVSLEDCLNLKCKSPLKIFALSYGIEESKCLIKRALKLSKDILENSPKDFALFAGLIPVAINQYNKATFKNRPCVINHPALPPLNIHATKYNEYNSAIDWYNAFTKYYAKILSYSPWDLESSYFSNAKPLSLLLPNGYSLCYDEKLKRLNKVKLLCNELMQNFSSEDSLCKDIEESSVKKVTEVEMEKVPI